MMKRMGRIEVMKRMGGGAGITNRLGGGEG
jgi:hypothetical protein